MVVFSCGVYTSGSYQGLPIYEDGFHKLTAGSRTSIKAHVLMEFPDGALCRSYVQQREFRFIGEVPSHSGTITFLNVLYHHDHRGTIFTADSDSWILPIRTPTSQSLMQLTETCTGMGAMGFGAEYAGWKVVASNELQPKMSEVLRTYMKGSVVVGSIEHLHVVAALHAASEGSTSFAMGFSCQPFSRAGDRKGGQDIRSMTLPWGLWTAYMLGCPLVVLECVADAPKYPFVKLALQQFEEVSHHVKSEVVLELNNLLPARRERWWCVLSAAWIGRVTLPELPALASRPTVSDMFEQLPIPSPQVVENMTLKDHEIRSLAQINASIDDSIINLHAPLPTALHSWSNQFHACPCECRNIGLSSTRLSNKGFYGVLASFTDVTSQLCYRHLTPQEVGLLNGLPLILGYHTNSRLEMAGVGQMASPIQSGWIFSAIRRHLGEIGICHLPRISLRDPLELICRQIFRIRNNLWPNLPISVAMQIYEKDVMALFRHQQEDIRSLLHPEPAEPIEGIITAGHLTTISPTLAWPQTPGALPGFNETVLPIPMPTSVSPIDAVSVRDRSRSPRVAATKSQGSQQEAIPVPCLPPLVESGHRTSEPTPAEPPVMVPVESVTVVPRESCKLSLPQKAADYLRRPPNVKDFLVNLASSGKDNDFQQSFQQHGVGCSPLDLLSDKLIIVDFSTSQFSAIAISENSKIEDLCSAEASVGHSSFVCRDAFGQLLSSQASLTSQQIVLLCPAITDGQIPEGRALSRALSVHTQGAAVAHDEMNFYLQSLGRCRNISVVQSLIVLHLADVQIASASWFSDIQFAVSQGPVASAILLGNHWIPVFVTSVDSTVVVHTTSEGLDAWRALGLDSNFLSPTISSPLMKVFDQDCGFQAFAWLVSKTYQEVESTAFTPAFAKSWRCLFWTFLMMHPTKAHVIEPYALGGHNSELHTAVAAILREHGVPLDQAASRAGEVLQTLGAEGVSQCLKDTRPWASLKQLANRHQPPIRLIMPKELQTMVEARSNQRKPVGNKQNKVGGQSKPMQCVISPADISIPVGVFAQQDGTPIGQLPSGQVGSNSRGVVVLSEADFAPFAQQTIISTEGLGFAILDPSQSFVEQYGGLTRFPAKCVATGEPILITAAIVQKGQKQILRATPPQLPSVSEVPVVTVKLMLYRDQCTVPWNTVLEGPVKHLLQLAPCLSVCRHPDCKCPATHASSADSCEPILDLWNRDYVNIQFRKIPAKDADIFTCHVRILESVFEALVAVSGIAGLFVEPRAPDGRGHCPKHHTVWLPKVSHAEVMQMKQHSKAPAFVVRVAQRYGLKASVTHAPQVHEQFRQDTPFLAGFTTVYVVGPLPWGCTRHTLQGLISTWNWPAKAIQPAGRSADGRGILWHAQASQPPQHPVITMSHGDVLIVAKDSQHHKPQVVAIEASSNTKEYLNASSRPLENDPWAAAAAKLPSRPPPGLTPVQVQQLDERIDRKLASCIPSPDGDSPMPDPLEPRVKALEDQIAKLNDSQTKQAATTQALSSQVAQVQQQVEHQGTQFRKHLDNQLADQMNKIEALLSKRPRNE